MTAPSTTTRNVLAGSWEALGSSPVEHLASLPLVDHKDEGARIALDGNGDRHLLVRTSLPARPWSQVDSPLKDAVVALNFGGSPAKYLDIRCASVQLFDVFDDLILDVLARARGSVDAGELIDSLLEQWRAMFRAVAAAGFGRERRFGLYAELLVLEACIDLLGSSALSTWTGPYGEPHDFEMAHGCLEVKAVGVLSNAITIHGFSQLCPDSGRPLRMLVYTLAESADGRTLAGLISDIEQRAGVGVLNPALSKVGYTTTGPDSHVVVVDSFVVTIDERFPALSDRTVEANVREAISRVEYDLPLTILNPLRDSRSASAVIAASVA